MFDVEIQRGGGPANAICEVYGWLTNQHIQPHLSRHRVAGQDVTFRVSFARESEASAFAAAFGANGRPGG